jgi:hypothetical protein
VDSDAANGGMKKRQNRKEKKTGRVYTLEQGGARRQRYCAGLYFMTSSLTVSAGMDQQFE